MSAARSPRVICGALSIARYSAGSRASSIRARTRVELARPRRRSARARSASAYALAAPSKSPRASRSSPICASDWRRSDRAPAALRKCSSAASASPCCVRRRQLAVQERAVGRARDRARVRAHRLVELAVARRLARGGQVLLDAAEPQHFDAPRDVGQRRIGGQRGLERDERVGSRGSSASSAWPPSDERRHVAAVGRSARARNAAARALASLRASSR